MKNGSAVAAFESAFAEYVNAKYCIALANGTATLHTALVALGVKPGDRVAVPPLTMSATTIAVLHAGAVPVFVDVDPNTWTMRQDQDESVLIKTGIAIPIPSMLSNRDVALRFARRVLDAENKKFAGIPVSLYGLSEPCWDGADVVVDAAQTLSKHVATNGFTSYSFQASKILPLGEGGMLATNDKELATRAREFSSLGYRMRPDQPRIDPAVLKSPDYARHHTYPAWNYRMSDLVAERGLGHFDSRLHERHGWYTPGGLVALRRAAAALYRDAIAGCSWISPQHVPEGWSHDYWTFAVALESAELWHPFVDAIVRHGGERPFAAWRLTYREPAFRHLAEDGCCPIAEDLQPRLVQFQTNDLASAQRNADAVNAAIYELDGVPA